MHGIRNDEYGARDAFSAQNGRSSVFPCGADFAVSVGVSAV